MSKEKTCFNITEFDENAYAVSLGKTSESSITIPSEIDGHKIVLVCSNKTSQNHLSDINISEGIKYLGKSCFSEYIALRKIHLPRTLLEIGTDAFFHCPSLSSVIIPENVRSIDELAFSYCPSLKHIEILNDSISLADDIFQGTYGVTIYCNRGSNAEAYAKANMIKYHPLTSKLKASLKEILFEGYDIKNSSER